MMVVRVKLNKNTPYGFLRVLWQDDPYTIPSTTVALKLTSRPPDTADSSGRGPTSRYSSVLKLLDFQPQLWLTENTSGALVNLVNAAPVALAHEIIKYAEIVERGSRYG
jgi:hypothetical protein